MEGRTKLKPFKFFESQSCNFLNFTKENGT